VEQIRPSVLKMMNSWDLYWFISTDLITSSLNNAIL